MRARAPQDRATLAEPRAPVAERVAKAYTRCGLSITLTSATDVCAFLLGATSNLPAIHVFCMYAAAAIMLTFCFMCTGVALGAALCAWQGARVGPLARNSHAQSHADPATTPLAAPGGSLPVLRSATAAPGFAALLAMDTRRVEANRFDMLPCITAKSDEGKAGDEPAVPPPSGLERCMSAYARLLMKPGTKAAVLVLFVALLSANIYGWARRAPPPVFPCAIAIPNIDRCSSSSSRFFSPKSETGVLWYSIGKRSESFVPLADKDDLRLRAYRPHPRQCARRV